MAMIPGRLTIDCGERASELHREPAGARGGSTPKGSMPCCPTGPTLRSAGTIRSERFQFPCCAAGERRELFAYSQRRVVTSGAGGGEPRPRPERGSGHSRARAGDAALLPADVPRPRIREWEDALTNVEALSHPPGIAGLCVNSRLAVGTRGSRRGSRSPLKGPRVLG